MHFMRKYSIRVHPHELEKLIITRSMGKTNVLFGIFKSYVDVMANCLLSYSGKNICRKIVLLYGLNEADIVHLGQLNVIIGTNDS